jgi:hypothetical protein
VIALAALHLLQDDAIEEHSQLGGADRDTGWSVAGRGGEAKDSSFKSLIPQAPSVLLPGQDLEPVALAVAEDEPVPGEGVIAEGLADEGAEAVERGIFLIPPAARTARRNRSSPSLSSIPVTPCMAAPSG